MEITRYITRRNLEDFLGRDISLGTLISISKRQRETVCGFNARDFLEIKIIIPDKEE